MKKIIAVLLAVMMLFSVMAVAVFAADGDAAVTYLIVFKDYDGTTIDTQIVEEGQFPRQPVGVPSRPAEGDTTYTFTGWKSSLDEKVYKAAATVPAATADTTYTATYQAKTPEENDNVTVLGFLASVFSRINRIFEQITKYFQDMKNWLDKVF